MDGESGTAQLDPRAEVSMLAGAVRRRWPGLCAGGLGAALVAPVAASHGGYFPTAWGWSALCLLWVAAVALLVSTRPRLTAPEWALLGGLFAFFGWVLASVLWAPAAAQPVLEGQRDIVYVAAALAALLVVRPQARGALLVGVWIGIAAVSSYSLATRLLPERLGLFDPVAGYRLSEPVSYWNGLGLFAGMGALLALGIAARARSLTLRALAAASTAVLLPTVYFTFSRGAWIAFGVGLVAAFVLDPRRLQLATAFLSVLPWPALGVLLASRSDALTQGGSLIGAASHDGHRLALVLVGLGAVAAGVSVARTLAEARLSVPRSVRAAFAGILLAVVAAAVVAVFVRVGSPPTLVRKAYDAFTGPPPAVGGKLNERLFSFSGSGRATQWRVAWHQVEDHPVLGYGAGSYERYWNAHRPVGGTIRDVHNLYLEVLAELGPFGLAILALALGAPLVAAVRARRHSLASAALAAYVAFLVHAAVDWDWELSGVTLAALLCAIALVLPHGESQDRAALTTRLRALALAGTLALVAFAFVGLIGNNAVAAAQDAEGAGDWGTVASQASKAHRWAPWATEPLRLRAEADYARGDFPAARALLRRAIAKDSTDWQLWFNLAAASRGQERSKALSRALRLNPLSTEIASWRGGFPKVTK